MAASRRSTKLHLCQHWMLDYHRAASDVNRSMGLKIKTEPSMSRTLVSSTSFGTPASPPKARASFGRQMPFFIGVAGKHHTASKAPPSAMTQLMRLLTTAGGTASGKTTVCDHIMQRLHDQCVVMLSQDSFYRGLTEEEHQNAHSEFRIISLPAYDMCSLNQRLINQNRPAGTHLQAPASYKLLQPPVPVA